MRDLLMDVLVLVLRPKALSAMKIVRTTCAMSIHSYFEKGKSARDNIERY